jgi:uncharacterized membrane protein HdeD (DUF308 family)
MLADVLTRNWGWVALRGVVALLFGLLAFFNPAITLATLVLLFGAYAFVDGIFMTVGAVANRRGEPRWVALLIGGLVGIGAGLVTFFMPGITAAALLGVIAAWAILTGAAEIAAAIRLRKEITREWMLALAGLLAVGFGLLLIAYPGAGALAVVLWIGGYAVVTGILLIALALQLRSWGRGHPTGATPRTA